MQITFHTHDRQDRPDALSLTYLNDENQLKCYSKIFEW